MSEAPSEPSAQAATVHPVIPDSVVLAPGAQVIGNVTLGERVYVGPNAVLRGDIEGITVGDDSNIQDCCVVHTERGSPTTIGRNVSMGHGAVVHGATIEDDALVGMNAVVLNGARVGQASLIGALSLVPERFEVPPRSLAVGTPCRVVKEDHAGIAGAVTANGRRYQEYRADHVAGRWGVVTGPVGLPQEPGRDD
ncbi:MAG: gamma carbonic anhydrase family protein [Thermoplasmatota archaeon]